MSAADQLNAFLTASGIARRDLGRAFLIVNGREQIVTADEAMTQMEAVNNTSQLRATIFFEVTIIGGPEDEGREVYIRPTGDGNAWETFDPRAPLTVADIT